jgi:hypothetical protein
MATKAYRRFVQRIESYNSDLELCDLMVRQFIAKADSDGTLAEALGSNNLDHLHLGRRRNNEQSRKLSGYHLKSTLAVAFIKEVFEDFSEFLSETLTKAAMKGIDPARFIGNVKLDLDAASILRAGNWDAVVKMISDALFRKLENERNTRDLIEKASVRINLQIDNAILSAAMPYLDARHIFVHRDGKADEKYRRDYPNIRLEKKKHKIRVTFPFVSAAKSTVLALAPVAGTIGGSARPTWWTWCGSDVSGRKGLAGMTSAARRAADPGPPPPRAPRHRRRPSGGAHEGKVGNAVNSGAPDLGAEPTVTFRRGGMSVAEYFLPLRPAACDGGQCTATAGRPEDRRRGNGRQRLAGLRGRFQIPRHGRLR